MKSSRRPYSQPVGTVACAIASLILSLGVGAAERAPDVIEEGCVVLKEFEQEKGDRRAELAWFRTVCDNKAEKDGYTHGFVRPLNPGDEPAGACFPEFEIFICCGVPGQPNNGTKNRC